MKREHLLVALFFLIAAAFFYLFYLITVPFFAPIAWAAVFAIVFFPLYEKLLARLKRPRIASSIMCLLIVVLIVGPIAYLFVALVNEAASAVAKVNEMYQSGTLDKLYTVQLPWMETIKENMSQYYDMSHVDFDNIIKESIDKVSGVILGQTSWLIANGTKAVFYFFLMIFSMFYFFRDGDSIIGTLKRLTPLTEEQIDVTFRHLRDVTEATMYGGVMIALLQGLLGGVLFAIVGIPSAIFWGAIMAFLSIIPLVGAFIVYVPAGIILILGGSYISGIVVIAAGTLIISQIDNVLRPMLISGKTSLHPLLLFFAIMGGIYLWGLLGIIIGPIIAAIFVTLIRILELRLHPEPEEAAVSD